MLSNIPNIKPILILFGILVLSIVIVLGISPIISQKGSETTPKETIIPAGFSRATNLLDTNKELVQKSSIQIIYSGVLTSAGSGSWTIEKGGKSLTITNETNTPVRYIRSGGQGGLTQQVTQNDISIGEVVKIMSLIDLKSGEMSVSTITVGPKGSSP